MILIYKFSPFIKSFQNKSVISGAVLGGQVEILRMILGLYTYENVDPYAI